MKKEFKIFFVLCFSLIANWGLLAQTSVLPTALSGSTSVSFDGATYTFNAVGVTYKYDLLNTLADNDARKGTLYALQVTKNGTTFRPSNYGGVKAEFNNTTYSPWNINNGSSHQLVSVSHPTPGTYSGGTEITVRWMMWGQNINDYCYYNYKFSISGQTLVMKFEGYSSTPDKISGIGFSNADTPTNNDKRVINIPYLPIMNVLYNSTAQAFVTLFADWETTNSSGIQAWADNSYFPDNSLFNTTGYYSQRIEYEKKTDGTRNLLNETVYLSVADNIENVLPNLIGPLTAPQKQTMWNRMVISYFNPFPYIMYNPDYYTTNNNCYIDELFVNYGVRNAAFIIKNWGDGQFDQSYPRTWGLQGPDAFTVDKGYGVPGVTFPIAGKSEFLGIPGLKSVSNKLSQRQYLFALHENYTDYYPTPGNYSSGLLSSGDAALAFNHEYPNNSPASVQSTFLKPSRIAEAVNTETGRIKTGLTESPTVTFKPNWAYLDVSSAVNPSGAITTGAETGGINPDAPLDTPRLHSYVDFDSNLGVNAARFSYTLQKYRELAGLVRNSYGGPVQGEGGWHFLYAGYFDDFEGRLQTGGKLDGYKAPLIIDFSKKIRTKSAIHGVGHIGWFFHSLSSDQKSNLDILTEKQIKIFMATELAYGHAALVTTGGIPVFSQANYDNDVIISRKHAQWSQQYMVPIQQIFDNASITEVLYFDGSIGKTASVYIRDNKDNYANIESMSFMGRVKVTYSNGLQVWVNRTKSSWTIPFSGGSGFYSWNVQVNNNTYLGTSWSTPPSLILPAEEGWLCYAPNTEDLTFPSYKKNEILLDRELPIVFSLEQNYPNPFNPETTISYSIPENSLVTLKLYDVLGREVATLVNGLVEKGNYKATFDGSKYASGIYFYKLTAGANNSIKKMLLLK